MTDVKVMTNEDIKDEAKIQFPSPYGDYDF